MNKSILSLIACFVLILTTINLASAMVTVPNAVFEGNTNNQLTGVSVIGFICENEDCTENRNIWSSLSTGDSNFIPLTYPTHLASEYGYQVYFYKEGYVPYKVNADWHGTGLTSLKKIYLYKVNGASAKIENLHLSKTSVDINEQITITADILSPRINSNNAHFVPEQLSNDYYSDDVKVTLYVNNNIVTVRNLDMFWDTEQTLEFTYTPTTAGTYNIQVQTVITDNKFTNSIIKTETETLSVSSEENDDTTDPIITVISPEDDEDYEVSDILFEITSNEDLEEAWVIISGDKIYLNKISDTRFSKTINLRDKDYEIVIYAKDLAGNTGRKTIEFSVDCDDEDNDDEELTSRGFRELDNDNSLEQQEYYNQFSNIPTVYYTPKETSTESKSILVQLIDNLISNWVLFLLILGIILLIVIILIKI
jgi:hypothetical protein